MVGIKSRFLHGTALPHGWDSLTPVHAQSSSIKPARFNIKSVLEKGERGAVVEHNAAVSSNGTNKLIIEKKEGDIDELMKSALLFVEKIDMPTVESSYFKDDKMEELESLGVGGRSSVVYPESTPIGHGLVNCSWDAFSELDRKSPGLWSLWQFPNQVIIPQEMLSPDLAFKIEASKLLIIPHPELPYDDFLGFKRGHADELMSFRHHFEEIAIKLAREGDHRSLTIEIERFDAALSDYLKKAKGSNIKKAYANLTIEMDWSAAVRGAMAGGMLSMTADSPLPKTAFAIGGGLIAGLSIKSSKGLVKADTSPLRYISSIDREFRG